jgi:peroxiredoxin
LIVVTAVVGGGWIVLTRAQQSAGVAAGAVAGLAAPDFSLLTSDGRTITLSDLRGQAVIVNFWATWCPPCLEEMPTLQEVYEAYRDEGLVVLAINQDEPADRVARFAQQHGLTFPLLLDAEFNVTDRYQVGLLPSTFFVDRAGVVYEVIFGGPLTRASLEARVAKLLEQR